MMWQWDMDEPVESTSETENPCRGWSDTPWRYFALRGEVVELRHERDWGWITVLCRADSREEAIKKFKAAAVDQRPVVEFG